MEIIMILTKESVWKDLLIIARNTNYLMMTVLSVKKIMFYLLYKMVIGYVWVLLNRIVHIWYLITPPMLYLVIIKNVTMDTNTKLLKIDKYQCLTYHQQNLTANTIILKNHSTSHTSLVQNVKQAILSMRRESVRRDKIQRIV